MFTDGRFTTVYPLTSRDQAGQALANFCMDVGVPDQIVTDLAGELSGPHTEFNKIARRNHIRIHWAEKAPLLGKILDEDRRRVPNMLKVSMDQ